MTLPAGYELTNSQPIITPVTCIQPTSTPTPTATPVTISVTTTCNSVGVVTATITFSPSLPSNATVNYVLRQGSSDLSGTTGSTSLSSSQNITDSTGGVYGSIVFRVTSVTNMPSRYTLTTSMPYDAPAVTCTQPTATNTPTNTADEDASPADEHAHGYVDGFEDANADEHASGDEHADQDEHADAFKYAGEHADGHEDTNADTNTDIYTGECWLSARRQLPRRPRKPMKPMKLK